MDLSNIVTLVGDAMTAGIAVAGAITLLIFTFRAFKLVRKAS